MAIQRLVLLFVDISTKTSLQWLLNFKDSQGQLARWMEELGHYNMIIKHRKGKDHVNADALSRLPDQLEDYRCPNYKVRVPLGDLPCGGCNYCRRCHQIWEKFLNDVDDAIPLNKRC